MKIHTIASQPHYHAHMAPIFDRLPDRAKGEQRLSVRVDSYGLDPDDLVMVGGYWDIDAANGHRVIYVEHGAGQTYLGIPEGHPASLAYPGGEHPAEVVGCISPRQSIADMWPVDSVAVGAPILDQYRRTARRSGRPLAVITFHFDDPRLPVPEMRSATAHYQKAIPHIVRALRSQGFDVVGHAHPRDRVRAEQRWRHYRVPYVEDADVIYRTADLLIADNTSMLYEMAALGIPVGVLNAPWYRTDVHHGLRFWDQVPGPQFETPSEVIEFDWMDYLDDKDWKKDRGRITKHVYEHVRSDGTHDGKASERASEWLCGVLLGLGWRP